jgi:low temperature requirement protein LtrA
MTAPSIQETPKQAYEVTPLELFFDLVFVFGVSQLSHHLLSYLSWRGAAETLVMLLAIFAVWFSTSWSATMFPVDEPRMRWMMLTVMLLGLFMNASVTRAFTTSPWPFILPFLLIQLGRAIWMIVNSTDAVFQDHYFRMLLWLIAATPLWVVGAMVGPEARLLWWVLAAGFDTIGRWLAHPIPGRRLQSENVPFDADHMLERCHLFLLIALGETVFTTGTAIAETTATLITLVTGTLALAGTVALWALSFGRSNRLILQHMEETSNPIRTSRYAVNVLMVKVAGLIAVAVANEMVIVHPQAHVSLGLSLLLGGGPILFLAAQGWYLWIILNIHSQLHLAGGIVMLLVCLVTLALPAYAGLILTGASLTTLAVLDQKMPIQRQSRKGV